MRFRLLFVSCGRSQSIHVGGLAQYKCFKMDQPCARYNVCGSRYVRSKEVGELRMQNSKFLHA